jgi:hypothetical protein
MLKGEQLIFVIGNMGRKCFVPSLSLDLSSLTILTAMLETTAPMREVWLPNFLNTFNIPNMFPSEKLDLTWLFLAFLSYLRLSIYMSIVSVAIIISFHLKNQPSDLELRMALPLGIVFWALGVACLAVGFGNYIKTVTKYSRRMALVQTGWKTQLVGFILSLPY